MQGRDAIRAGVRAISTGQFGRFVWPTKDVPPTWGQVDEKLAGMPVIDYRNGAGSRSAGPSSDH